MESTQAGSRRLYLREGPAGISKWSDSFSQAGWGIWMGSPSPELQFTLWVPPLLYLWYCVDFCLLSLTSPPDSALLGTKLCLLFTAHRTCSGNICCMTEWVMRHHISICAVSSPRMPSPSGWWNRSKSLMRLSWSITSSPSFPWPPSPPVSTVLLERHHCTLIMSPLHLVNVTITSSCVCELLKGKDCV